MHHHPSRHMPSALRTRPLSTLMARVPSRKERLLVYLCQRIAQLELDNAQLHHQHLTLPEWRQRHQALADSIPQLAYTLDERGFVLTVNAAVSAWGEAPQEWVGSLLAAHIDEEDRERVSRIYAQLVAARRDQTHTQQFRLRTRIGETRWLETRTFFGFSADGRFLWCQAVCRDLTPILSPDQTRGAEADRDQANLRILGLMKANEALQRKIDERFITEMALRDREAELEMEKRNLQETNTALKVLLKRREEDKRLVEEQVMYNVKKLVLPFLSKVQKEGLDERQRSYLEIVEANLRDITCGFSRRLSLAYYGLTTSELKVANFIRQGKKNREIADLLSLSVRTVEAYRQAIRNKLRLQNKKINLRTFLMSIN